MTTYDVSAKGLDKLRKKFGADLVKKAEVKALNDATRDLRTFVSKALRKVYNIEAAAVSRRVTIEVAQLSKPYAMLIYRGRRVGLINFKAQEVRVALQQAGGRWWKKRAYGNFRKGVSVVVKKGGKRTLVTNYRSRSGRSKGFIAIGKENNKHIFYRIPKRVRTGKSKGKQAIRSALTWSIPEMVVNANGAVGSQQDYHQFAVDAYRESLNDALDKYLGVENTNA